jgi:hypothetical protein
LLIAHSQPAEKKSPFIGPEPVRVTNITIAITAKKSPDAFSSNTSKIAAINTLWRFLADLNGGGADNLSRSQNFSFGKSSFD